MALPKLNSAPKYEMTIPSSGKLVRYRPFLVKEEKSLMIASESGNPKDVFKGLVDTIGACVEGEINTNKLTSFDVEYMFLQMRAKSVGETSKVGLRCSECEHSNEIGIRLDDIKIEASGGLKTLTLTDEIQVEIGYPTFYDIINSGIDAEKEPTTDQAFGLIRSCLKSIITQDERIDLADVSTKEIQEFLDSMSAGQFQQIKEFVDGIPKLTHDVEFECTKCKHQNKITIEGIANFLS